MPGRQGWDGFHENQADALFWTKKKVVKKGKNDVTELFFDLNNDPFGGGWREGNDVIEVNMGEEEEILVWREEVPTLSALKTIQTNVEKTGKNDLPAAIFWGKLEIKAISLVMKFDHSRK